MGFKMLWYREVITDHSNEPEIIAVIFEAEMGFENSIHYIEKEHFWSKPVKKILTSDVPISDYILGKGEPVTLLMKQTWENKLVPLVTKDRRILKGITPILKRFTKEKDEEIEMLKDSMESLQSYYTQQLISYHEHYNRMYASFQGVVPLLLKIMHQRFETIRQFVRKDFSEHDFNLLISRVARDAELELLDEFKQDVLDIKYAKVTPPFAGGVQPALPAPRPRRQKSPRKPQKPPPQEEAAQNPFGQTQAPLPPMLPEMASLAGAPQNQAVSPPMNNPSTSSTNKKKQSYEDLVEAINSGDIEWGEPENQ
ncbi:MAG: hypothetical protein ACFFG0_10685 [Candidatus Thorarchaeota archaeon]